MKLLRLVLGLVEFLFRWALLLACMVTMLPGIMLLMHLEDSNRSVGDFLTPLLWKGLIP